MQLKWKKILIVSIILVYVASFLLQSNFMSFQIWAQEKNKPRVNVVTILVDNDIFNSISDSVESYANYVQSKLADTKALVMPLDLKNISAYDVYRMMENIYFDWLKDVNSSLIWLVMVGNIPLPVVNQNWYIFPTVYPYVDFENQKYVWDSDSEYFVPTDNINWQAEIWHWLIDYGDDINAYIDFFDKVLNYNSNPEEFIWDSFWYEDFVAEKEWFLDENYQFYKNKIMFAEDLWYQRYHPLMKNLFSEEQTSNWIDILEWLQEAWVKISELEGISMDEAKESASAWWYTTKAVEQEIKDALIADYTNLFSYNSLTTMRENLFAWGRWIEEYTDASWQQQQRVNADTSSSKIQLKDTLYLWNDSLVWLIQNRNNIFEKVIDKKIEDEWYSMDIIIPVSHDRWTTKKVWFKKRHLQERWENYYFGKYALYIEDPKELSIYRWTYRNLDNLDWVTFDSLKNGYNPTVSDKDSTNVKLKSIGASYDIFSTQAEWNRWFTMMKVQSDLDTYKEKKQAAKWFKNWWRQFRWTLWVKLWGVKRLTWSTDCWDDNWDCESLDEFAQRWWWWASSVNLETGSMEEWRYSLTSYVATNSWRSIYDMWWFQKLLAWKDEWDLWKWWVDWKWEWPQTAALSFKSYLKYASPTKVKSWEKMGAWYVYYDNKVSDEHESVVNEDYWSLKNIDSASFEKQSDQVFQVIKGDDIYVYKTLSSVIKHDSTTDDEINGIDYEKYSESGVLWRYFSDISKGYMDVENNVKDVVNSSSQYAKDIVNYKEDLNKKKTQIKELIDATSQDIENIKKINGEIDSLATTNTTLKKNYEDCISNCQEWNECKCEDPSTMINWNESDASNKQSEIQSLNWWIDSKIDKINEILGEISENSNNVKQKLIDMYTDITSLSPDGIDLTLSHVIYSEWWNPEEYSWKISPDTKKIPMLTEWKSVIINSQNNIEVNYKQNVDIYKQTINDINSYTWLWNDIESILSDIKDDIKDRWSVKIEDENANNIMNNLVEFECEVEDETWNKETKLIILDEQSLSKAEEINGEGGDPIFEDYFDQIKIVFNNLVENDDNGEEVVKLAKSNQLFTVWLIAQKYNDDEDIKNQIMDLGDMINKNHYIFSLLISQFWDPFIGLSSADIITAFSKWAKSDWYDVIQDPHQLELIEWVIEHMSGLNYLTPDRPIDSPRYVSMQSIAGNDINFIYPDLFKVEVFKVVSSSWGDEIHELMSVWEIRLSLEKYIKWKVAEYNSILDEEKNKALQVYNNKKSYFDHLMQIDGLATPNWNRSYQKFTYDDFVKAIWWEEMLDVIADVLYYQNLTNKKKHWSNNIEEDIKWIKESFSVNYKREHVLQDYLIEGNTWNVLMIPTYNENGYEVVYVNSDAWDYIVPSEQIENVQYQQQVQKVQQMDDNIKNQYKEEADIQDECNIPSDWKLSLFEVSSMSSPWLDWFKCWLDNLKWSVNVTLNFDYSLWNALDASWLNIETESSVQYWDSMSQYADDWSAVMWGSTTEDSSLVITQLQVEADKHNKEYASGWFLATLYNNIKIYTSNTKISEAEQINQLQISSASDIKTISMSIIGTWDSCLAINGESVCWSERIWTFNPKEEPFTWLITSLDHKAWVSALDIKFSLPGSSDYVNKVIQYSVLPSSGTHFEIWMPSDFTVAWMVTPVILNWWDAYENKLWLTNERYKISVDKWEFVKDWAYVTWFTTNDFRNLNFYYHAPLDAENGSEAIIQVEKISMNLEDLFDWKPEIVATRIQTLSEWNPQIKINNKVVLKDKDIECQSSYNLKSDESIYTNGVLNVSKLQKMDIDVLNLAWKSINVTWQVIVLSKQWLVKIWDVKTEGWKSSFYEASKFELSWGHLTLYYYPTTVAWDDVIYIDIQWLERRKINLTVNPSTPYLIEVAMENGMIQLDGSTSAEMKISDIWWNLVNVPVSVEILYNEEAIQFNEKTPFIVNNGYKDFNIKWLEAWVEIIDFVVDDGVWTTAYLTINKSIFPTDKLNALYLNYFWDDWWNQWWYFSSHDKYIENIMSHSNKLITTTTQLVSEDKIKKMVRKLEPWLKIYNPDNVKTQMVISDDNLNIVVWDITTLNTSISAKWKQISSEDTLFEILNSDIASQNYIYYIPSSEWYLMDDWILFKWNEQVLDIKWWEVVMQLTPAYINWNNVWTIMYKGSDYWSLVMNVPNFVPSVENFKTPWYRYVVKSTFTNGSTANMNSIWVFDMNSDFELKTSYKSIQNSKDLNERIWFLWDFKNITLFAEWQIVWEATKAFWSEFVINLWDPVLSRKSSNKPVYWTRFSWWIWREIYSDSENVIYNTYQIDYDKDGTKDLLVVYLDWTLKLSKNYWWTPDYRNMQELMRIAVWIEDVYVSDVDGNGYEDIIIRTNNNQLRVYLNNNWKFDVDWNVACLNTNVNLWWISEQPSNLSWVNQFFVEDMDLDWIGDIVTSDSKWYIKIFYWGNSKWGPNYLSTEKYACDTWWYEREVGNIEVVTALWLKISKEDIYDNSMIYRDWLAPQEVIVNESDLTDFGIDFNPDDFEKSIEDLIQPSDDGVNSSITSATSEIMDWYNLDQWVQKYLELANKYANVTLFENTLLWQNTKNYTFIPISYLDPDQWDLVKVRKNYSSSNDWMLSEWDKVVVTVTIKAYRPFKWAFWDVIQWPWTIYYDNNNVFKSINFLSKQWNAQVKQKDWNFAYLIDNIELNKWEVFKFQYELKYNPVPFKTMDITYQTFWSDDLYPDIKLNDSDWCNKNFNAYLGNWRVHVKKEVLLQDEIDKLYDQLDNSTTDNMDITNEISDDFSNVPWIVWDKIERTEILNWFDWKLSVNELFEQGGISLSLDWDMFEWITSEIESTIDDISKWMCNGFEFGWSNNCKWLPVPFNQAFLAPWKYHLFGCINLPLGPIENWIPAIYFPWTAYVPYPIPMIDGLKLASDGFMWIPWGEYPSFIRIYVAPTLTAQVWVWICVGPYATSKLFPSPLGDVAWNCVVFAVKPQCKKSQENLVDKKSPVEQYDIVTDAVKNSGMCTQSQKAGWHRSSPFDGYELTSTDWISVSLDKRDYTLSVSNWWMNNETEYSASFFWIVNLETDAIIWWNEWSTQNAIYIWNVNVLWWDFTVNKIRWGLQQWIRKLIIDKWLDPQIRYIANQLTKMTVTVKLPQLWSLIDNELAVLENVTDNAGSLLWDGVVWVNDSVSQLTKWFVKTTWTEREVQGLSSWTWLTYANIYSLNKSISNPFEALASLINESNLINISMNPITVKVPMILSEDINGYEIYLRQWIDTNSQIIEDWWWTLESLWTNCGNLEWAKRDQCYVQAEKNIEAFVDFRDWEWKKMLDQVYVNIQILQEYRNFPFEIYEWIHVLDRYMSEISSLINNTIWYLSYWLQINSARFVWYVDAIVLILDIIKTYQLLIDFSVSWSENCWNCAKDTYDQYSCKLSMLCDSIELPIIQIPNFKIPNITLDLTNLNLWLDLILPKFNFQPVSVDLPELPNLPTPPSVSVNIKLLDLPNIPLLPSPPELPELPSFIPNVEMELPILPPAPKVPRLPNTIEWYIKIATFIWKVYCIVKWKFWLVGEKSVKAKIEQLTQRTYEVAWIDRIMDYTNRSATDVKNYWVDYEISTMVDLQFDLDPIYNFLDTLTTSINNKLTGVLDSMDDVLSDTVQLADDVVNSAAISDVQFNATLFDGDRSDGSDDWIIKVSMNELDYWLTSDKIEYVNYEDAKDRLQNVLTYFRQQAVNTTFTDRLNSSITKIENQFNSSAVIEPNEEWVETVKKEVLAYVEEQKESYNQLAMLINDDYDKFLAMVSEQYDMWFDVKSNSGIEEYLAFNTRLFNVDSTTKESLLFIKENNPYKDIIENKQSIVDWYRDAVNTNSASDLWLTSSQYLVLRTNIHNIKSKVDWLYSVVRDAETTNLVASNGDNWISTKTLVASNWSMSKAKVTTIETDPSAYAQWIYEKIKNSEWKEKLVKVLYSDTFTNIIWDNYKNTNNTDNHDILLWTKNSIYMKEMWNVSKLKGKWVLVSWVIKEIPYKETWLEFDSDTHLKIADADCEVKNRRVVWQTYDSLSFSWDLSEEKDVDWYLIKLVDKIDYSYEKADYTDNAVVSPKYVLAVPNDVTMTGLYDWDIKVELLNKINEIKNIYGTGKDLVEIVYYNTHKSNAEVVISWIDRKWYYARIATLNLSWDTYNINSSWSNQIVAWKQIVWDNQIPLWMAELFRNSTEEVVSQGDDLMGFVWTTYELRVTWEDNVALQYVNISQDWKILQEAYISEPKKTLVVKWLFHTNQKKDTYTSIAIDQYGNEVQKVITVSYDIPEINIIDISETEWWDSALITASLSQDIDQWDVAFQRERWESRKSMVPLNNDNSHIFALQPKLNLIEWEFTMWKWIVLNDKDGKVMATLDSDTGELKIDDAYSDSVNLEIRVDKSASLWLYNDDALVFDIVLPIQSVLKIEAENYSKVDIPENWKMGMYNWWIWIAQDGNIILYISKSGNLYSEIWLVWQYEYDRELQANKLTLYQWTDIEKINPIIVWLKVEPFEMK